ncbi:mesoderm induction early response protein 1 [Anopheles maculipalpis]|uniref:mesoderm induction early response protein 1 n=1 Tax=Anopheles maculipalpis TaxID=1496333 RepID=UPI002158D598|nr:mesoderm induction early response protein 1 [Anopheles maculipalpis]
MSTEEEHPGISDAPQQDQLTATPAPSKEASDTKPAIEVEAENEHKSDTSNVEQRSEQDGKPAQTKPEALPATSDNSTVKEESKTEDVLLADSSSGTSEYVKTDPLLQAKQTDSSPQQKQPHVATDPSTDTVPTVEKLPTPVAAGRADEDDDEEDEDDEDPGDNEDQEERQQQSHQQPQQQQPQQRVNKERSDGGDSYSNEEDPNQNAANQRQDQSQTPTGGQYYEDDEEDEEDEGEEPSELRQLFEPINDSQALSEDEEDGDYIPDEEVKKTIMVGSDFQAVIPEGLCRYDDALPYENEDKLLWNPTILNEQEIEEYLVKITGPAGGLGSGGSAATGGGGGGQPRGTAAGSTGTATSDPQSNSVYAIPLGNHLRDDEQSLYLLQQCGHNIDEALRRKRISNNAVPVPEQQMSIWSEEECRNFENGLRVHGKDFHLIQQTKVRTRSVGELVQFYYLWKKTERHDLFASKARLEKKKYNLHPGLTDHMDRFLEEQENSTGFGDRSSSPGFNSLYSNASEAKRQRLLDSKENNTTASNKRSASNL